MRIDMENFIKDQKGDKNLVYGISKIRKVESAKWSLQITSRQNTEEDKKVAAADGEWTSEITWSYLNLYGHSAVFLFQNFICNNLKYFTPSVAVESGCSNKISVTFRQITISNLFICF